MEVPIGEVPSYENLNKLLPHEKRKLFDRAKLFREIKAFLTFWCILAKQKLIFGAQME